MKNKNALIAVFFSKYKRFGKERYLWFFKFYDKINFLEKYLFL